VSIVLLSDGHNDSGTLAPLQAARLARRAGVAVDTIALAGSGGPLAIDGQVLTVDLPDRATLHAIATTTGGRFADATNAGSLRRAYTRLGNQLGWRSAHHELSSIFLAASALLVVGAGALAAHWSPRLP
jgi:hypothetical protein